MFPCNGDGFDAPKAPRSMPGFYRGFKDQTLDHARIEGAFHNGAIIGSALTSDLLAIDIDVPKPAEMPDAGEHERRKVATDRLAELVRWFPELNTAGLHTTPTGGFHLILRKPEAARRIKTGPFRGRDGARWGDVRGQATAYIVLPPSTIGGRSYEVVRSLTTRSQVASDALLDFLDPPKRGSIPRAVAPPTRSSLETTPYGRRALENEVSAVAGTPEGGRNVRLNEAAFNLGQLVAGDEIASEYEVIDALMSTPVAEDEPDKSRRTIRSGLEGGKQQPRTAPATSEILESARPQAPRPQAPKVTRDDSLPEETRGILLHANLTDAGNAERLAALYGDRWRHMPGLGDHTFAGTHWQPDHQRQPRNWVTATMRLVRRLADDEQASRELSKEQHEKLIKHTLASENLNRINGAIELARSLDAIHLPVEKLDRSPDILNVQNGRLDLTTGELKRHDPSAYDTKVAPVEWNPEADHWAVQDLLELLEEDGREPLLQEIAGAALAGRTEKKLWLLIGNSGSGKSTLTSALASMLGAYAQHVEPSTLLDKQYGGGGPRADLVRLRGARLAIAAEMPTTHGKLNPGLLKRITGGDVITARKPHQTEEISFLPTFTLLMHANGRPAFDALDVGMLARVTEIPFNAMPRDPTKPVRQAVTDEPDARAALLLWAVTGALRWYRNGRQAVLPESVTKATADYTREMDPFAEWAEEALLFEEGAWASTSDLYASYTHWCDDAGIRHVPGKLKFARWLASRPGVTTGDEARRNRVRGALGVRLRS